MRRQLFILMLLISGLLVSSVQPGTDTVNNVVTITGLAEVRASRAPLQTGPKALGLWSRVLPDLHGAQNQLSIAHMSLLPNGKVLFWGRDKGPDRGPASIDDVDRHCDTYLWDLSKNDVSSTPEDDRLTLIPNNRTNLFCSAHSFLPNGNLFVVGGDENPVDASGTVRYDVDGHGVTHTNIFNYASGTWSAGPNMLQRRWYPSVVTLSNGETLIVTGSFATGFNSSNRPIHVQNKDTEILDRNQNLRKATVDLPVELPNYPFAHMGPDGKVLVVSGSNKNGLFFDPSTETWDDPAPPALNLLQSHDQGTSVMYDTGKIMAIGGRQGSIIVTPNTETIDINPQSSTNLSWVSANPMNFQRYYATSVLMPDGQVFVVGGSKCGGANNLQNDFCSDGAIMQPEIYDPATGVWSIMAHQQIIRMYHSVALLLPDARILVAGGGRPGAYGENGFLGFDKFLAHRDVEVFSPPYLFNTDGSQAIRPIISSNPPTSGPRVINYGQSFNVTVGNVPADQIDKAVLVRLPSVTHALNFDQRRVVLPRPTVVNQQTISIAAPANGLECPPGPYMLFVFGPNNTPSEAMMMLVSPEVTNTLTVTSSPGSGVSVSVTPSDNTGQGAGVTTYTRTYNRNTSVTLTAPATAGGLVFSAWQRDGLHYSTNSTVPVVMDVNHTMNAVYVIPPAPTLTVTSNPSGVGIQVTPIDNAGQSGGWTTFTRTYNPNTSVTLTAPVTTSGGLVFSAWQRDGVNFSTDPIATVVMDVSHTMRANYVTPSPGTLTVESDSTNGVVITVTPNDINGRGSGAIPFIRTYNPNTSVTLTAPATAGSKYFQGWSGNGGSSANHTITITMDAYRRMSPSYMAQSSFGSRVNLALATTGAVASASSTYSSAFPASAVNNGDRKGINWGNGGGWNDGTPNSYPDWVQIDFNRTVFINEVDVYTVQDNFQSPVEPNPNMTFSLYGITAYDVQYWNGTSWVNIRSVTSNNYVSRTFIFLFTPVWTSKIRVLINNALNSYSRVTEIEAYANNGPAPARR